jgi:hypothetical protein
MSDITKLVVKKSRRAEAPGNSIKPSRAEATGNPMKSSRAEATGTKSKSTKAKAEGEKLKSGNKANASGTHDDAIEAVVTKLKIPKSKSHCSEAQAATDLEMELNKACTNHTESVVRTYREALSPPPPMTNAQVAATLLCDESRETQLKFLKHVGLDPKVHCAFNVSILKTLAHDYVANTVGTWLPSPALKRKEPKPAPRPIMEHKPAPRSIMSRLEPVSIFDRLETRPERERTPPKPTQGIAVELKTPTVNSPFTGDPNTSAHTAWHRFYKALLSKNASIPETVKQTPQFMRECWLLFMREGCTGRAYNTCDAMLNLGVELNVDEDGRPLTNYPEDHVAHSASTLSKWFFEQFPTAPSQIQAEADLLAKSNITQKASETAINFLVRLQGNLAKAGHSDRKNTFSMFKSGLSETYALTLRKHLPELIKHEIWAQADPTNLAILLDSRHTPQTDTKHNVMFTGRNNWQHRKRPAPEASGTPIKRPRPTHGAGGGARPDKPRCEKCLRRGHTAAVCYTPQCLKCQKWGHNTEACYAKPKLSEKEQQSKGKLKSNLALLAVDRKHDSESDPGSDSDTDTNPAPAYTLFVNAEHYNKLGRADPQDRWGNTAHCSFTECAPAGRDVYKSSAYKCAHNRTDNDGYKSDSEVEDTPEDEYIYDEDDPFYVPEEGEDAFGTYTPEDED